MTTHTVKEIAPQLGVSTSTVYRWLASGEITTHGYTGHKQGRRWIITGTSVSIEGRIRAAYTKLTARRESDWVMLSTLRPRLADVPRDVLDTELDRMIERPDVDLKAELNQIALTEQDREAAVDIGGEPRHLLRIGPA